MASSSLAERVGDRVAGDSPPLRQDVALQPLTSTSTSASSSSARSTVTVSPSHPVQAKGHVLPYQAPASHIPPPSLTTAATPAAFASTPASASTSTHASAPTSAAPPSVLVDNQDAAQPPDHIDSDDSLDAIPQPIDDTIDMASKKTPFLRSAAARSDAAPYGSVSLTPSRNNSPAGSDRWDPDSHQLRHVPDTLRSETSHRSILGKKSSSRLSEEIDGAVLVSGLEGRLGITEPTHTGVLEGSMKDDLSEDGALLDDASSTASDSEHQENSPHEAVRASVPPTDNTTLSINTPRMWCLSVIFAILGSSTNLFFSLRYPSVAITPVIALLLVHPLGHLWDFVLKRPYDPEEEFIDGVRTTSVSDDAHGSHKIKRRTRWRRWLAQGRWNEKEHTCVYVSSNVAFGFAFATDVIVEQTQFYNQEAPIVYQLLLTISTQILGYGFAGLTRRFLVRPSGMIWPGTLMSAAMFSTLHKQENKPAGGWTISRWKFFYIVWTISFLFYFLPGLLMPALSYFNVITWFAPKNVVIANLFGVSSGLGLFPLTFDWAQVTYVGSPLLVPFWAAMNVIGGLAVVMWIIAPILYYTNVLFSSYMPILSAAVFDNTGKVYDVSKILTPDFLFDREAYQSYSRVFLPITYVLSYGVQFAGLAALLTHTACWHGQDIWRSWKRALEEAREDGQPKYEPVADSPGPLPRQSFDEDQRRMSTSTSHVDGIISREDIHSKLMKRYKDAPLSWSIITFLLASSSLFKIVATLVSSLTQIGVLNWMFANIKGICTSEALNGFTCPIARVHFNGSILWGVVGPNEFFGPKAIYRSLVWFFPLGALLPIPLWLYCRRNRSSILRKVNLPVIFGAMSWIPPATGLNFSVWVLVCYVFNYLIKNRHNAWWSKYTMTLSAALDSGLAFGIVVVFFGFIYPGLAKNLKWWGTEVYKQGCDWQACSYNTLPEGERFGPKTW
ncbi:hypothetical protein FOXG_08278 [Fusarium oxysporum f. sp. lycopersici 4287]|uniref:Sexual differentiation process protein isp4 n=2 Tax=Fusarium oxysporum TaxID=5507 RepID=A0A0J9V6T4_FUSO4|nr:hypothetical protein FOXG_08278 [Fusarium oxysporum f. sp. lycopersici 4287]KNB06883.1 hypothetical protein FOXG_08278 [Fusarium oxysporum f. sp. lycopersici 4287]